ncbi:MAG: nitroreductase family protein [Gammaproteobacteria bacterium]|jgi:nitroreductase|nr:nitroreductase family protein [Gammaproteobacteria bacterium]MDP6695838.1 nitroreductase family protein [Gammaproteobacteria bacterium]
METRDAIRARRAIKHFDPNHEMTDEEKREIISHAMLAPTAFNIQHWRFVVVEDKELRKQIRTVAWDQAQVTDASMFIVLCADFKAWEKNPGRYWDDAPPAVREFMLPEIEKYYLGKPQVERDEAFRSCGIVAQTLMLTAQSMGYSSCPMDGFDFDAVGKLINLPDDHLITMFIAIGKGVRDAWPRPGPLPMNEVVIPNRFGA